MQENLDNECYTMNHCKTRHERDRERERERGVKGRKWEWHFLKNKRRGGGEVLVLIIEKSGLSLSPTHLLLSM